MKSSWFYDIEIFPNFFSATFINSSSDEERVFITAFEKNEISQLLSFITNEVDYLFGYNNIEYDDIILLHIFKNQKRYNSIPIEYVNLELFEKSKEIISDPTPKKWFKTQTKYFRRFDLMKMLRFDDLMISLKHCALKLNHDLIQDLPISFDSYVTEDQVDEILKYNRNDVVITKKIGLLKKEEINLRFAIANDYDIDVISASDSKIANKILEKYYISSGANMENIKMLRTDRRYINLSDIIAENVVFKSDKLKKMLMDLKNKTIDLEKDKDEELYKLYLGEKLYIIAKGGLHSKDSNIFYVATEDMLLLDADVTSYYPNIVDNLSIFPAHLDISFCHILKRITDDRTAAKKLDKKSAKAQTLKITSNSVCGKMKEKNYWLYDPKALYKVTINGQLYLLMLIEDLELNGFRVFSANTDGIVTIVQKDKVDLYNKICKDWEIKTRFSLEYTQYKKLYMRDVNCYVAQTLDDKLKLKGDFEEYSDLNKSLDKTVVRRAIINRLIHNIPIDKTIRSCDNIYDFCLAQRVDNKFEPQYHHIVNGEYKIDVIQKTNRFYISNSGGALCKKSKVDGKIISIVANHNITLLNRYEPMDIKLRDVNYDYYIKEAEKVVLPIINSNGLF